MSAVPQPEGEVLATWPVPRIGEDERLEIVARRGEVTVVVGPNGAGKSALGDLFCRTNNNLPIARLSAHRQLWFGESGGYMSRSQRDSIGNQLRNYSFRDDARWKNDAGAQWPTSVVYDLMAKENEYNSRFVRAANSGRSTEDTAVLLGRSPFATVSNLLRSAGLIIDLRLQSDAVSTGSDDSPYEIARMSDGEKSALLLAAEVYLGDDKRVFVIDEPERHLHRSISAPLIDSILSMRDDCHFVVLTHDLDLAASLDNDATNLYAVDACEWEGTRASRWSIQPLEGADKVPYGVRTAILGGRKRVLYVEGDASSLDRPLYELLFPSWPVVPSGGCEEVIRSTKGLASTEGLHWVEARGIVDGDRRSPEEIGSLRNDGVHVMGALEIEGLYYCTAAIRAVAGLLTEDTNPDLAVSAALEAVNQERVLDHLAAEVSLRNIQRNLLLGAPTSSSLPSVGDTILVEVPSPFSTEKRRLREIIDCRDLDTLVLNFPVKGSPLPDAVARSLGLARATYEGFVRKAIQHCSGLKETLLSYIGSLP